MHAESKHANLVNESDSNDACGLTVVTVAKLCNNADC